MLVVKFGGTSVADASAFSAVADIIRRCTHEPDGVIVVLSATAGTTSGLLEIARMAGSGEDHRPMLERLIARHRELACELVGASTCVDAFCDQSVQYAEAVAMLGEWNQVTLDGMAAFGELMSSAILHAMLSDGDPQAILVDARDVIIMSNDGTHVDFSATDKACRAHLNPMLQTGQIIVTQGFIARDAHGRTTTLGRGGSDYSAAIIGAALHAREIMIYTDVSGVYSADPRIVADARPLASISFEQMQEMASYGAKVLHPETITPAIRASIPVRVLNTFSPDDKGTCVTSSIGEVSDACAVAILRSVELVTGGPDVADYLLMQESLRRHVVLSQRNLQRSITAIQCAESTVTGELDVSLLEQIHQRQSVSMIAVTGCQAGNPEVIRMLSSALAAHVRKAWLTPMSLTCLAVIVDRTDADVCMRTLHEAITHRQDQVG